MFLKWVKRLLLLSVAILLFGEVAARYMGVIDFPLYDANNKIGYIPAANQQGIFVNRNRWVFNSLHMGAGPFIPSESQNDLLLIGDSVVLGGNLIDQKDKLGPQLSRALANNNHQSNVWPISAGSWSLANELEWIRENPEVLNQIDQVVFILNSEDFSGIASSWSCNVSHPLSYPVSALWWLAQKESFTGEGCWNVPEKLKVQPRNLTSDLKDYLQRYGAKTKFILYPNFAEAASENVKQQNFMQGIELLRSEGAAYELIKDNSWWANKLYYRDDIHPSVLGYRVLAEIISRKISGNTD